MRLTRLPQTSFDSNIYFNLANDGNVIIIISIIEDKKFRNKYNIYFHLISYSYFDYLKFITKKIIDEVRNSVCIGYSNSFVYYFHPNDLGIVVNILENIEISETINDEIPKINIETLDFRNGNPITSFIINRKYREVGANKFELFDEDYGSSNFFVKINENKLIITNPTPKIYLEGGQQLINPFNEEEISLRNFLDSTFDKEFEYKLINNYNYSVEVDITDLNINLIRIYLQSYSNLLPLY